MQRVQRVLWFVAKLGIRESASVSLVAGGNAGAEGALFDSSLELREDVEKPGNSTAQVKRERGGKRVA